ncbi:MAG: type II toxin-antitoxin system MqsA family antitoxin [Actinomycetota bacterium]
MKECPLCGGELEPRVITHPQEYKGEIYIIENVPVEVCVQCNEVLLSPEILEKIQQLVWSETAPKRTESVPVYDLAEAS